VLKGGKGLDLAFVVNRDVEACGHGYKMLLI
jgi:hypothetical protein